MSQRAPIQNKTAKATPGSKASTTPSTQNSEKKLEPNYDLLPKINPKGARGAYIFYSIKYEKKEEE